jgi:RND family efflux transporter MFP subunit
MPEPESLQSKSTPQLPRRAVRGSQRPEVRERLLRAALELVNTQGIQNFTQARVAAAAGVRQSHLTYYFPTRNDLLKALVQQGCAEFEHALASEFTDGPEALERLREGFAARTSDCAMPRLMVALTVASEEDASLKRWLEDMERNVLARLRELFARFGLHAAERDLMLFHVGLIGIALIRLGSNTAQSAQRARTLVRHAFDTLVAQSRSSILLLALLAASLGVGGVLTGCSKASSNAPAARPAMTVTAGRAEIVTWPSSIETSGNVTAWQEAVIGSRLAGLPLAEVRVNVGDHVRRGELLARFDDASPRADVAQAEAAVNQARANARETAANRDRALKLKGSGALSDQSILQAETQADASEAQVASALAALASAKLRLEYTRVTAPDDGIVSSRTATLGAVTVAGGELFKLIRQGRLEWRAELTPTQLAAVHPGLAAKLTLPDGSLLTGKVRELAPSLDANSRLGLAYVDLAPDARARAGLYAHGIIETSASPALTVPAESIVIHDGRSYLAQLNGERVELVPVTTGRREGGRTEVLDHLAAGQPVAVRGAGFLSDGDLVRVVPAEAESTVSQR